MRTSTRVVGTLLALGLAWVPVAAVAAEQGAVATARGGQVAGPGDDGEPVADLTGAPSSEPTAPPTAEPTAEPTTDPTSAPEPTATPSPEPTGAPSAPPAPPAAPPAAPPTTDPASALPLAAVLGGPTSPMPAPAVVDAYAPYDPQAICDPTPKPGTVYLQELVIAHYGAGRRSGISRACHVGVASEHKESRAFDWGLNVANPTEAAVAEAFVAWLTATGPDGKVGYNARRLGVMHVIWNRRIWSNSSQNAAWRPYTGPVPHTDHVHVSLSWDGALQRTSWWTGKAATTSTSDSRYVRQVYADLFGRTPDAGGLATWTAALKRGAPRGGVADAITSSPEYRGNLITGVYAEFLGRAPDPEGLQHWLRQMNAGMTIQTMEGGFLASPEYYAKAGGTPDGWVRRLYAHVLGRTPAASEVAHWTDHLAHGWMRDQVARGFLISSERLTTVIDGYYQDLLGRSIDPTGRGTWVTAIQNGSRTEQIIAGIVASEEYYQRAQRLQTR